MKEQTTSEKFLVLKITWHQTPRLSPFVPLRSCVLRAFPSFYSATLDSSPFVDIIKIPFVPHLHKERERNVGVWREARIVGGREGKADGGTEKEVVKVSGCFF